MALKSLTSIAGNLPGDEEQRKKKELMKFTYCVHCQPVAGRITARQIRQAKRRIEPYSENQLANHYVGKHPWCHYRCGKCSNKTKTKSFQERHRAKREEKGFVVYRYV